MIERQGRLVAAREMVGLVRVASVEGWPRKIVAVVGALGLGTCDGGAVLYIFREPDVAKELGRFERLMPELDEYDQLLTGSVQLSRHPRNLRSPACSNIAVRRGCLGGAANFVRLAEQAAKDNHGCVSYLEARLGVEYEERDRQAVATRIRDAQLPRVKTLRRVRLRQVAPGACETHSGTGRGRLHRAL